MDRLSVRLTELEFKDLDALHGGNRTDKVKTAIKLAKKYNKKKGKKHGKTNSTPDTRAEK